MSQSYEKVFEQAPRENAKLAKVLPFVPSLPELSTYSAIESDGSYHYGIVWNDSPETMNVIQYGPSQTNGDIYTCWAS